MDPRLSTTGFCKLLRNSGPFYFYIFSGTGSASQRTSNSAFMLVDGKLNMINEPTAFSNNFFG